MDHTSPDDAIEHVEALYREHRAGLFGYLYARCGRDRPLAEDLLAEVFVRALGSIRRDGPVWHGHHTAWLYRIAANLLTDHWRRRSHRPEQPVAEAHTLDTRTTPSAEDHLIRTEQARMLHAALDRLTHGQRAAIMLKDLRQMSTHETAQALGRTHASVAAARHKALASLHRSLPADTRA